MLQGGAPQVTDTGEEEHHDDDPKSVQDDEPKSTHSLDLSRPVAKGKNEPRIVKRRPVIFHKTSRQNKKLLGRKKLPKVYRI